MSTRITQYGFELGSATVTRIAWHEEYGALIDIEGKRQRIEIRVTPSGLVRASTIITKQKKGTK